MCVCVLLVSEDSVCVCVLVVSEDSVCVCVCVCVCVYWVEMVSVVMLAVPPEPLLAFQRMEVVVK